MARKVKKQKKSKRSKKRIYVTVATPAQIRAYYKKQYKKKITRSTSVKKRKGPPVSATAFPIGKRKRGNDGKMWQVIASGKSRRWGRV